MKTPEIHAPEIFSHYVPVFEKRQSSVM